MRCCVDTAESDRKETEEGDETGEWNYLKMSRVSIWEWVLEKLRGTEKNKKEV